MSIVVSCACGQRFAAELHLAGQTVRCPVCGQGISVPLASMPAPQAHVPPVYPQQPAPAYGLPGPKAYRAPPPARSRGGPLLYLGIGCGVLLLFVVAAVAVTLVGYDLARTTLKKKPAETVAKAAAAEVSKPQDPSPIVKSDPGSVLPSDAFEPPAAAPPPGPPSADGKPPLQFGFPPLEPAGDVDRLAGPVVVFQMLDYRGGGESGRVAKAALTGIPWFNGAVVVNHSAGEIIIGVRGQSINTGAAKTALEAVGFKIGSATYKPRGRQP